MTERAELDDLMTPRDGDGNRIPRKKKLKSIGKEVLIITPNWGDAKEWAEEFSGEDVDAMDSDKIAEQFRKFVREPDLSNCGGEDIDNMKSSVVQEILDLIMEESGLVEEDEGETKN